MAKKPEKAAKKAKIRKLKPRDKSFSADALSRYLQDISKIKPLTREEEYAMANEIRRGNLKALQEMVRRNLKYVVTVANKFKGCGLSFQDLIEEGNIGLIQAAKRFDPERHVKFITYAVWWVRQAIMHFLAEQTGTVRLPIKQVGKIYKIGRKFRDMTQNLEREPTAAEVAENLGMGEEDMETLMRAYRTHLSLDTPLNSDQDTSYLELLESPNHIPYDDQMIQENLNVQVNEMLHHLSPREEQILRMRFGFVGDNKTLDEIGAEIGLSRERVRQIEKRAKARLKMKLLAGSPEN
jgi:RNA polymerase primary sigma factor